MKEAAEKLFPEPNKRWKNGAGVSHQFIGKLRQQKPITVNSNILVFFQPS